MNIKRYLVATAITCMICGSVSAELVVNRAIVLFDSYSQVRQDVEIVNTDEAQNLFVDIEAFAVARPGQEDQELISLRGNPEPGLIATPQKAMLGPSNNQLVRLMNLDRGGDQERVFRVNMTPVSKPPEIMVQEVEEGVTASKIQIVIAYQALVIVPPAEPRAQVDYARDGKAVTFSNGGNSNYLLTDGRQCDPSAPKNCRDLVTYRVYPSNQRHFELPFDGPFTYKVRTLSGMSSQRFD